MLVPNQLVHRDFGKGERGCRGGILYIGKVRPSLSSPCSREPGIYHDSGILGYACLTWGQQMPRLEDPHLILSTSTDLRHKHNRDVVHDGRELHSLPLSLLVTSLLLDFALILIPCTLYVDRTVPCTYSLRILFTLSFDF